jgi:hypothetical protein
MNFVNLPVPAGNGVGAAVEVGSHMAALKTIMATGTLKGSVTIEVSTDPAGLRWGPLKTFTAFPSQDTLLVVATFMRVRVSGFLSGVAEVSVGGEPGQILVDSIIVPLGTGVGPAVLMRDDEYIKTFVVSGPFTGSINIEISQDQTDWAPLLTFTQPTTEEDVNVVCTWMRARSANVKGTPFVDVATSLPLSELMTVTSLPLNVDLFVNATTGSDSNPGTLALPLQTWDGVFATMPPQYTGYCRVHWAAGDYFVQSPVGPPSPLKRDTLPRCMGPTGQPVAFIGAVQSIAGAPGVRTVTNVTSGWQIEDNTMTLAPRAAVGAHIRVISGFNTGWRIMIKANDATHLELVSGNAFLSNGDQFVIEAPASNIHAPGGIAGWDIQGCGNGQNTADLTIVDMAFLGNGAGPRFVRCSLASAGSLLQYGSTFVNGIFDSSTMTTFIGSVDPSLIGALGSIPGNNNNAWDGAGLFFFNSGLNLVNGSLWTGGFVMSCNPGFVGNIITVDSNSTFNPAGSDIIDTSIIVIHGGLVRPQQLGGSPVRFIGGADFLGFLGGPGPLTVQQFGQIDGSSGAQFGNNGTLFLFWVSLSNVGAQSRLGAFVSITSTASYPVLTIASFQYGIGVVNISQVERTSGGPNLSGPLGDTLIGATPTPYAALPFTDGTTLCRMQ